MSKIAEFSVNLNTNRQVYYPGSQIAGYVVLNLIQPMNMRGLRIELEGKAHCHWTVEEGSGDDKRTVSYEGHEKYFELVLGLFGNLPNSGSYTLAHPAGRHIYQFSFSLPTPIPSSFEGKHGYIRYILKAQIDKPWKFDHKVKRPITINEIIDPNDSRYSVGPGGEKHKTVGCCCWIAGPLDVVANIDRGCYCPGEAILINAQVNNLTSREMNGMKARLYQSIKFHSSGVGINATKHEWKKVGELRGPRVLQGQYATWENQAFGIPALPPSIFNSKIITINYEVQFEVDVPWGFDPCIKMPIVLGTVPYRLTYGKPIQHYGTPEDPQQAPTANFGGGPNYPPPQPSDFGYPGMAPPSYSAAVGESTVNIGDGDDTHTQGDLNYMPVYTFARPYEGNNAPPPYTGNDTPSNQTANNFVAPYPADTNSPYPSGSVPYPVGTNSTYSSGSNVPYPAGSNSPYPSGNNVPYNSGQPQPQQDPFSPCEGTPYPPAGPAPLQPQKFQPPAAATAPPPE